MWSVGCVLAELLLGHVSINSFLFLFSEQNSFVLVLQEKKESSMWWMIVTSVVYICILFIYTLARLLGVLQPLFPGESGVDQLVEIIKV